MCGSKKFGVLGLISYPYWFLAEWLAPFAEAGGILFVLILAIFGLTNWPFFLALSLLVYVFAITVQEVSYQKYQTVKDIWMLIQTALLEPFLYHPRTVKWSIKGNYDKFTGQNKGWGEMTRKGFKKQ